MRPSEVLDHQGALLDYLSGSAYAKIMTGFLRSMERSGKIGIQGHDAGRDTVTMIRRSLQMAQAFHVQDAMMPLIKTAAADLDGTDYFVHERLPAEHGFLMFDDPYISREVWGRGVVIKALQWWHGGAQTEHREHIPGFWLVTYVDALDERDEVTHELIEKHGTNFVDVVGRLQVFDFTFVPYERRIGPQEFTADEYRALALGTNQRPSGERTEGTVPNENRIILALFRLLGQVLVEVKDAPLDRPTLRRAKRMNLPARVQTIALRRKERRYLHPSEPGSAPVEWQHQWPVRGHWAWRACGADHPLAEPYEKGWHARIYVAPYWKGPEDKPVRLTEKVWDLSR